MNLKEASHALASLLGDSAKYVWAIGLLAAGQASTCTGTYTGQFVMEGFLDLKLPVWQRALLTRSIALVPALTVCFVNEKSLTHLDFWLNIL